MKWRALSVLLIVSLFAVPSRAFANAGTPLMWAGMLHLLFGNALIGIGEGTLLAWVFSAPNVRCVWVMILANYVSAWGGGFFLQYAVVQHVHMDLANGWKWFWILVFVTYCLTLVIEWPFVAFCVRGKADWIFRSLKASLLVQTASYGLIFGGYWMASGTSLYTQMHIVKPSDISLPESVVVYFISSKDGNVFARPLNGGSEKHIFDLQSKDLNDRLFVNPSKDDTNAWDLVARIETGRREGAFIPIRTNVQLTATPDWRLTHRDAPKYDGTWFSFGEAEPLSGLTNAPWKFRSGFWAVEGLRAVNEKTGEHIRFSYETPFGAWPVRDVFQVESNRALFQLSDDQICVFDPDTRRVALLWHGRGPVPVIENANGNPR